jgi:voltage-gated potassium channel
VLFTVEYLLRLISVTRPVPYVVSFFGLIDLLSVLPTYLALVMPGTHSLMVIRAVRLLRVFRILKLARFVDDAELLGRALRASRRKITVFLGGVLTIVLLVGTLMYLIEGEEHGFTSIPTSMYWAVVTMTTVGYGDIAPKTGVGRLLAACVMILGYGILAVPTGIVSVELAQVTRSVSTQACPACGRQGHDIDASHCKHCGAALSPPPTRSDRAGLIRALARGRRAGQAGVDDHGQLQHQAGRSSASAGEPELRSAPARQRAVAHASIGAPTSPPSLVPGAAAPSPPRCGPSGIPTDAAVPGSRAR